MSNATKKGKRSAPATLLELAEDQVRKRLTVRQVARAECFCCAATAPAGLPLDGAWIGGALMGTMRNLPLCARHVRMFRGAAKVGGFRDLGEAS